MRQTSDLNEQLDLAASRVNDATNIVRGAAAGRLPMPHRRRLTSALRHLEAAEQELFKTRNDPWPEPEPRPRQLTLGVG